jgi:tripartite-type tricarboxylate transporter receptor subunit TctC
MLRGNIIGTWGSWGSAADNVGMGRDKVVLQSGKERDAELPDTPTVFEMVEHAANPERTVAILTAWESLHAVGRPLAVPPGTPADRIQFLSDALYRALHDPELLAAANKGGRTIVYASADEMRQIVTDATEMPDDIRQLFVRAVKGEL